MSTLEDVFLNNEERPKFMNYNSVIVPQNIGCKNPICNLKYKCYIRQGEECPICYDPIMVKSNAFLSNCGHQFHKSCLFEYMKIKWRETEYTAMVNCPICRKYIEHPQFGRKYVSSYFGINSYKNGLDKLEDLWLSLDYILPEYCSNGYKHYLGVNNKCFCCKAYREKGEIIYEF